MKITHCKLKKKVQKELLRFFVLEVTARSAADILGIHPNSAVLFYRKIRMVISHHLALAADEVFEGPVELDESCFGGRRKGRRGRGAAGKVVVFGILKRNGRVYTVVVDNGGILLVCMVKLPSFMVESMAFSAGERRFLCTNRIISRILFIINIKLIINKHKFSI